VVANGIFQMAQTCPRCSGSGSVVQTPCDACHGEGKVRDSRTLSVTIPAGVETASRLRIKGEGESGKKGKGDLFIVVEVLPHSLFQRQGSDLTTEVSVTLPMAVLGTEALVPTLDGNVVMKIPAGTQSGSVFRLKGKGMPELRGSGIGDEMVKVVVEIPRVVNEQQRRLMEEFAKTLEG
jgi:molecular chaperone DnaJ